MSSSLIPFNNNKQFVNRIITCDEKWFFTIAADISSVVASRRTSKTLPKAKLAPKKDHVTVWWSADRLVHNSFLNPSETITLEKYAQQIDEIPANLHHLQPALINRKDPVLLHNNSRPHFTQPMLQKLSVLGCEVLAHSADLLPTNYHFLKHLDNFLQQKCFYNQQDAKMLSKSLFNLELRFLWYRNKQTYLSFAKMCWL